MDKVAMLAQVKGGNGFIAALDQSGGSTPKALRAYGVDDSEWSGDDEMFAKIHEMRSRVITAPSFSGGKVLGAILFEKTMDGIVAGLPTPDALKSRGVVPFIKVDQGLEDEADGVQLMKPMDKLDALLEKSVAKGMFGTKMRSVINNTSESGIRAIVEQQFEIGNRIIDAGLMPIIEPEVNIKSADRAESDRILKAELERAIAVQAEDRPVMLKLSIPAEAGLYAPIIANPKVARVVALSGGFSRAEAASELAKNHGMIASFSRALLEELRAQMSDAEFDAALGSAIDEIYAASVA